MGGQPGVARTWSKMDAQQHSQITGTGEQEKTKREKNMPLFCHNQNNLRTFCSIRTYSKNNRRELAAPNKKHNKTKKYEKVIC